MTQTAADRYDVYETVSVRIDQARVMCLNGNKMVVATDANEEIVLDLDDPQLRVTRVTPADGEPRAGELWRDGVGSLWFAVRDRKQIWLVGAESDIQHGGRSRVAWPDVHRDITGPIRRVWWREAGQDSDNPDLPAILADLPLEPAIAPDEQCTVGQCPGDPHCRAGHRCPEHQVDPLGLRDRLADRPDQP